MSLRIQRATMDANREEKSICAFGSGFRIGSRRSKTKTTKNLAHNANKKKDTQ